MPFNNIITRADAAGLIPEEVSRDLLGYTAKESAVLTSFRRIPAARAQVRVPVLSALPTAYWVTGDTGLKQTTEINWANKFINIEEMAAFVPVPQAVLDDADYDIWGEARPALAEAIGRTLDESVFFGVGAPASFPTNVNASAAAAGNAVTEAAAAGAGGFFGDFDNALAKLEEDGYFATGVIAAVNARGRFRTARSTTGERLDSDRIAGNLAEIDGVPITYPMRGQFPTGGAAGTNIRLFVGDWRDQFVVAVRQDINYEIFREGVIQDNTGAIVYNLMQQDMVAMRVTWRGGWQVANTINRDQPTEANRYPAAVLRY